MPFVTENSPRTALLDFMLPIKPSFLIDGIRLIPDLPKSVQVPVESLVLGGIAVSGFPDFEWDASIIKPFGHL